MKPTQEQIRECQRQIKVMQDWCDGKIVQRRPRNVYPIIWSDALSLGQDSWDWTLEDYHTKPEPPTLWMADWANSPIFYLGDNPSPNYQWKKYTLHEVLP